MSLTVSPELLADAQRGEVADEDFLACVQTSLPYAFDLISQLARRLERGQVPFADNVEPPPNDRAQGELLRAMSSDAIRAALERRFGVTLAFQNCHRVAAFAANARGSAQHQAFTSNQAQLLNQRPEFVNC